MYGNERFLLMKNWSSKKGFTLGELLIVVAIIGVLVSISIPIFTNQLKKARLATNEANARTAYAAASAKFISEDLGVYPKLYKYDIRTAMCTNFNPYEANPSEYIYTIDYADWTEAYKLDENLTTKTATAWYVIFWALGPEDTYNHINLKPVFE